MAAALVGGGAADARLELRDAQDVAIADPGAEYVPGEVLVRFRSGVSAAARAAALKTSGASLARELSLPGVVLARLAPGKRVEAAAAALSNRPDVVYAEPNWVVRAAATPNDPLYGAMWALNQASDVDIDAPEAWDTTTGSSEVVVAVVDTGIAYDHPDLAPNIWTNSDEIAGNGVDDDGNGKVDDVRGWDFIQDDDDPRDLDGHGTHVAGTIGAKGDNATGITGINWNVKVMPVRVLRPWFGSPFVVLPPGGTTAQVAEGLAYAAANGADVVNASLAVGPVLPQTMKDAIDAAPDTLFVAPAGNNAGDNDLFPRYPCNFDSANVVCVAATTATDDLYESSRFGAATVDLGAPGVAIESASLARQVIRTEDFESETGWVGGGSPNTWARTQESSILFDWGATDSPVGDYANNTANWFQMPGSVDLSGRTGCGVRYSARLETAVGDALVVDGSTDGVNWDRVGAWSGSTVNHANLEDSLRSFEGAANVRLRLGLVSDGSGTADGVDVDHVQVVCANYSTPSSYGANPGMNGTSAAAAHVSGVAALAWAKNPGVTVAQVKSALLDGGDAIASLSGKTLTGRRLNAAGTLALIPTAAPETVVSGPSGTWGRVSASFALSSVPVGGTFECRVNGGSWSSCSSPFLVATVVPGYYLYEFRATDAGGTDASPASAALRVVRPFTADWESDGKANIGIWRPAVGAWYVDGAATNWFGLNGDVPVPGQWDADPEPDRAIWRPDVGGWHVEGSATVYHGALEDVPVPADWDGNGVLDQIVWRPDHGGWYVRGFGTFYWGQRGDVPVLGDYDADPQPDLAVYRDGAWYIEGSATVFHGLVGDVPVPADWDGDGKTDIAVYRPSNSTWYVRDISTTSFGITGDVPVVGDFDADPAVDRAIWRPESGGWYVEGSAPVFFGLPTDIP